MDDAANANETTGRGRDEPTKVEYVHAPVFGNGVMVAEEFAARMAESGVDVDVHHIDGSDPGRCRRAGLYVFSSPGRFGRPIRKMRRFLKKVRLPAGTDYALVTTEAAPKPDKKTGRMPTDEELAKQRDSSKSWRTRSS